jgi:transcriptional regulator with XRE-family HTH domain
VKARSAVAERLGLKVADLRLKLNLAQKELAAVAGTTTKVISQLERGVSVPSVEKLADIASALHAQLADLFEFAEDVSDRRHRAMVHIGYMLRGRQAKDLEAVRDLLKLVFEIKRRERPE